MAPRLRRSTPEQVPTPGSGASWPGPDRVADTTAVEPIPRAQPTTSEPSPSESAQGSVPLPVPATPRTRTSAAYVGVAVGVVALLLILIFIVENLRDASVSLLGAHLHLPEGIIVLASAVGGGLTVLMVSLARVIQLRVNARRHLDHNHPRQGRRHRS